MKIKQLFTFIAALAILGGAVSCSNDELQSIDQTAPATDALSENVPINISTYVGQSRDTRAGTTGAIEDLATLQTTGFGIFAQTLGSKNYETALYGGATGKYKDAPTVATPSATSSLNVYKNGKAAYDQDGQKWKVTQYGNDAVRYWPNPSRKEDGSTVPQYVSFFAYAPYAGSADPGEIKDATWGIKGWNLVHNLVTNGGLENTDALSKAIKAISYRDCDPVIHYSATKGEDGKMVDLLWGTAGTNGKTYAGEEQNGAKVGDETQTTTKGDDGQETTTTTIEREGLEKVNIDLQKMKPDGKVGFDFKHALAKIGGIGSIYADIQGIEKGDAPSNYGTEIQWIAIELTNAATSNGSALNVPTEGYFNLATGKWATAQDAVAKGATQVPRVYFISNATTKFTDKADGFGSDYLTYYFSKNKKDDTPTKSAEIDSLQKYTIFCKGSGVFNGCGWKQVGDNDKIYVDENGYAIPEEDVNPINSPDPLAKGSYYKVQYLTSEAQPLLKPSADVTSVPAFYFIPDANETNVDIKAKVVVNWKYDGAYQTQTAEVKLPNPAINTAYKLYIHLNVESIKVDAKVDNWSEQEAHVYPGPGNNSDPNNK